MKRLLIFICLILGPFTLKAQYYFLFLNSNPSKAELPKSAVDSLQKAHIENIGRLARENKLLVAGPFEGGGGLFILNTSEFHVAQSWILTDPAIQAGRYLLELLPYKPRINIPCLASEDAAMSLFTFVRYEPYLTKFNVQQAAQLFQSHDEHLKKVINEHEVITEGIFLPNDGGILIIKGELNEALIMQDPAVHDGILFPQIKKLYMAEGSFCEGKGEE